MTESPLLSVLDSCPVRTGESHSKAVKSCIDIAAHAESLGYERFWLTEHHGVRASASSATSVLLGIVGSRTNRIRLGAGGILLPHHTPYRVAEQFGTLDAAYRGRIDLGLGKSLGSVNGVVKALSSRFPYSDEAFVEDVNSLRGLFGNSPNAENIEAVPGQKCGVCLFALCSSPTSGRLAGALGLPIAVAGHIAGTDVKSTIDAYRLAISGSSTKQSPYVILALNVYAASTIEDAFQLTLSSRSMISAVTRGINTELADIRAEGLYDGADPDQGYPSLPEHSVVATEVEVGCKLRSIASSVRADEILVTSQIFDHRAYKRSLKMIAHSWMRA